MHFKFKCYHNRIPTDPHIAYLPTVYQRHMAHKLMDIQYKDKNYFKQSASRIRLIMLNEW